MGRDDERGGVASAADALSALFGGPLGEGLTEGARVARAWYAANGDRERRHTTGVWLRKSGKANVDPVLVVALDSNLLAAELGTNKELYLARLAFRGVAVSDIRFTVGKAQRSPQGRTSSPAPRELVGAKGARGAQAELPRLSEAERASVDEATEGLPDGLRQSVSRAVCASLRRYKATPTRDT